jgi:hypothetical protein
VLTTLLGIVLIAGCSGSAVGEPREVSHAAAAPASTQAAEASYVVSSRPDRNFGASSRLLLDGSPQRRAYLKFRLDGTPTKATLRVYAQSSHSTGYAVHATGNGWTESTLTYGNAPAVGTRVGSRSTITAGRYNDVPLNVAGMAAGNLSLVLTRTTSTTATLSSDESSNPPTLVVEYPGNVVVWAVGDLCDDFETADCDQVGDLVAADPDADALLALGDLQYDEGSQADFQLYYARKMGHLNPITHPVPGNHEYMTPGATGYFDYWGARAGERDKGYYSVDIGAWRLVAANSNCSQVGGCGSSSPQGVFISSQLAAAPGCALVYDHHPAFTDGNYSHGTTDGRALFNVAQAAGADLFVSGHDHNYQRFAPRNAAGAIDLVNGLRQFVSGLGGVWRYPFQGAAAEYRTDSVDGALRLTLTATGYSWEFRSTAGAVLDAGTGTCH